MANKALKSGRFVVLEPMNPYERRIIHAEIQSVDGVTTASVGEDTDRRVVIYLEDRPLPSILTDEAAAAAPRAAKHSRRRRGSSRPVSHTTAIQPDPEGEEYYMDAPTTYVHAPTPRQEKLKSLASYFGEEEDDQTTDSDADDEWTSTYGE